MPACLLCCYSCLLFVCAYACACLHVRMRPYACLCAHAYPCLPTRARVRLCLCLPVPARMPVCACVRAYGGVGLAGRDGTPTKFYNNFKPLGICYLERTLLNALRVLDLLLFRAYFGSVCNHCCDISAEVC